MVGLGLGPPLQLKQLHFSGFFFYILEFHTKIMLKKGSAYLKNGFKICSTFSNFSFPPCYQSASPDSLDWKSEDRMISSSRFCSQAGGKEGI